MWTREAAAYWIPPSRVSRLLVRRHLVPVLVLPAFAGATLRDAVLMLLRRLHPFRGAAPERVAMFGAEEAEVADFGRTGVGGGDGQDFRLGGGKFRTQKLDRRPRRPGIVGQAQRA